MYKILLTCAAFIMALETSVDATDTPDGAEKSSLVRTEIKYGQSKHYLARYIQEISLGDPDNTVIRIKSRHKNSDCVLFRNKPNFGALTTYFQISTTNPLLGCEDVQDAVLGEGTEANRAINQFSRDNNLDPRVIHHGIYNEPPNRYLDGNIPCYENIEKYYKDKFANGYSGNPFYEACRPSEEVRAQIQQQPPFPVYEKILHLNKPDDVVDLFRMLINIFKILKVDLNTLKSIALDLEIPGLDSGTIDSTITKATDLARNSEQVRSLTTKVEKLKAQTDQISENMRRCQEAIGHLTQ